MQAFNNSKQQSGRSSQSCGYCRTRGHSIKECPFIKHDHDEWAAFRVPHKSPTLTDTPLGRWAMNDYSYWNKQIAKYYPKWERWQQPTNGSSRAVSTSPRLCGFCRGEGHTRRDCPEMAKIYKDLLQANRNYRQSLYDTFVSQFGLGVGAVIKVQQEQGRWSNREVVEKLVTIDSFDMDTANLFLSSDNYSVDRDYCGTIGITFLSGNEDASHGYNRNVMQVKDIIDQSGRHLARKSYSYYAQAAYVETIAPSTQPLDPEWVDLGADAFEWLLKKRTKEWLEDRGMITLIDQWK